MDDSNQIDQSHLNPDSDNTCLKGKKGAAASLSIPHWRLWLYRLIAVIIIPLVVLGILEVSLRLIGYGYPASAMVETKLNGQRAYCNNFQFGWRFWPQSIARESEPYTFTAKKSKDSYRVFVLGGSGVPRAAEPPSTKTLYVSFDFLAVKVYGSDSRAMLGGQKRQPN